MAVALFGESKGILDMPMGPFTVEGKVVVFKVWLIFEMVDMFLAWTTGDHVELVVTWFTEDKGKMLLVTAWQTEGEVVLMTAVGRGRDNKVLLLLFNSGEGKDVQRFILTFSRRTLCS